MTVRRSLDIPCREANKSIPKTTTWNCFASIITKRCTDTGRDTQQTLVCTEMSFDDVRCRLWACAKRCSWKVPKDFPLIYAYMCIYHPDPLSPHFPWVGPSLVCHIRHAIPSIYSHEGKTSTGFRHTHSVLTWRLTRRKHHVTSFQCPCFLSFLILFFFIASALVNIFFYFYIVFHEPFEPLKICFCKRLLF